MSGIRKRLLRVMLIALAVAAVAGAAAVLMGAERVIGRVAGTALCVACTTGLMIPASLLLDRRKMRDAGLLLMGALLVEFLLMLWLIWMPDQFFGSSDAWSRVLETIGAVALVTLPGVGALRGLHETATRWAGRAILGVVGIAFVLFLLGTWGSLLISTGRMTDFDGNCWGSGLAVGGYGVTGALALLTFRSGDRRYWRWLGVAAAVVGVAMALFSIWGSAFPHPWMFVGVTSLAVVVAQAILLLTARLGDGQAWVRRGAIAAAAIGSAFLVMDAYVNVSASGLYGGRLMWTGRAARACLLLSACGTLAVVILTRLNRGVQAESLPTEFSTIALTCPRCRKSQTLGLGDGVCAECGLRIHIQVEEPRCTKCGYLLYGLKSNACPECGTPVGTPGPKAVPA